jgi:hypothetical protein
MPRLGLGEPCYAEARLQCTGPSAALSLLTALCLAQNQLLLPRLNPYRTATYFAVPSVYFKQTTRCSPKAAASIACQIIVFYCGKIAMHQSLCSSLAAYSTIAKCTVAQRGQVHCGRAVAAVQTKPLISPQHASTPSFAALLFSARSAPPAVPCASTCR